MINAVLYLCNYFHEIHSAFASYSQIFTQFQDLVSFMGLCVSCRRSKSRYKGKFYFLFIFMGTCYFTLDLNTYRGNLKGFTYQDHCAMFSIFLISYNLIKYSYSSNTHIYCKIYIMFSFYISFCIS